MRIRRIALLTMALSISSATLAHASFSSKLQGNTLTLTQTADSGNITLDNNGTNGAFRITEGGTQAFSPAYSLVVRLQDGSRILWFDLDQSVHRDVTIHLGNGNRNLQFTGSSNNIRGNLTITAGTGNQTVYLAEPWNLAVGGRMRIDLGRGDDRVVNGSRRVVVSGEVVLRGVNSWVNDGLLRLGSLSMFNDHELIASRFENNGEVAVLGSFEYRGGNAVDQVDLGADYSVGGDVAIRLGHGTTSGNDPQLALLPYGGAVGGRVTIQSGDSTVEDHVKLNGSIRGKVKLRLGAGLNSVEVWAALGGSSLSYKGGPDQDDFIVAAQARNLSARIDMGGGPDHVSVAAGASLKALSIDLGPGSDSMTNNLPLPNPFRVKVKGL